MALFKGKASRIIGGLILLSLLVYSCTSPTGDIPGNSQEVVETAIPSPVATAEEEASSIQATGEAPENDPSAPIPVTPTPPTEDTQLGTQDQDVADIPTERKKIIVIDPGHGGPEIGAANYLSNGVPMREKDINLEIAFKLKALLEQNGYQTVMTRETDARASTIPEEELSGYSRTRADLQARVDIANNAKADLFISIHNNGSADPWQSGTEVWYSKDRTFADRNLALAELMLDSLIRNIRATGYQARDRGIKDDSNFRVRLGRTYNLFVLGPARTEPTQTRATQMPGILGETLFVSNPTEAALLARDDVLDAIALGYYEGIVGYFEKFPDG